MGAWIETLIQKHLGLTSSVAPYMGAWIETYMSRRLGSSAPVAPYMGAWIETVCVFTGTLEKMSRSLYGSVD